MCFVVVTVDLWRFLRSRSAGQQITTVGVVGFPAAALVRLQQVAAEVGKQAHRDLRVIDVNKRSQLEQSQHHGARWIFNGDAAPLVALKEGDDLVISENADTQTLETTFRDILTAYDSGFQRLLKT